MPIEGFVARPEGKFAKMPDWLRSYFVDTETGEFYVPAAASGNEDLAFWKICLDGNVPTIHDSGHLYVPASWLIQEYPEFKQPFANFKRMHAGALECEKKEQAEKDNDKEPSANDALTESAPQPSSGWQVHVDDSSDESSRLHAKNDRALLFFEDQDILMWGAHGQVRVPIQFVEDLIKRYKGQHGNPNQAGKGTDDREAFFGEFEK